MNGYNIQNDRKRLLCKSICTPSQIVQGSNVPIKMPIILQTILGLGFSSLTVKF